MLSIRGHHPRATDRRNCLHAIELVAAQSIADIRAQAMLAHDSLMTDPTLLPSFDAYRSLVADAAEGMTILDAHGTIVFENHAAQHLFGWESGVGRSVFERIHVANLSRLRETVGEVLSTPKLRKQPTMRLRHRDGR
jgi:PAS domain-containing protein